MSRRRPNPGGDLNVWPAYVDVLATLLLVIILLVLAVTITQFYTANRANQAELIGDELSNLLLEQQQEIDGLDTARANLEAEKQSLLADIATVQEELGLLQSDRDDALEKTEELLLRLAQSEGEILDFEGTLTDALVQMDNKLSRLIDVLGTAKEAQDSLTRQNIELDQENRQLTSSLADLGERINDSLLLEAEELQRQRSVFFGTLIEVLGEREDISVVGDRFVFQSEVLFATGSAELGVGGQDQLRQLATTILDLAEDFPDDLDWILRIDGHTDARPIGPSSSSGFENNWQLSSERARSVVEFLIAAGGPPERLTAAGFGEYQPLIDETTQEAYARNRRIEVKLTTR